MIDIQILITNCRIIADRLQLISDSRTAANNKRIIYFVIFATFLVSAPQLFAATAVYAQQQYPMSSGVISGYYTDDSSGLQIDLPEGWSGTRVFGLFPIIAPNGFDLSRATMPEAVMTILVLDRSDGVDTIMSGSVDEIPSDFEGTGESNDDSEECHRQVIEYSQLGATTVLHMIQECKGGEDTGNPYQKTKAYGVLTRTNFIIIAYSATTASSYGKYVNEFEESIKTLKVIDPVNFRSGISLLLRADKVYQNSISVKGQYINVNIETSSRVSNFNFNEEEKRVSLRVEGTDGTTGILIMPLQNVLQGPYTVTIDGQPTDEFLVIEDKTTGEKILQISYSHSVHDVTITGASVVPEFPAQLVVIVGAVLGLSVILTRTKLIPR